ncbi:MAG: dUTP diphosphatase [Gammaproteobacteria bacterium]|nr:dUTP diphosphatase [Gammaproteobacteria bacterium]
MDVARIWRQLAVMAEMQDDHNRLVHPLWRQQGHDYYRAVWVECAELLDHYGWKWWKQQRADLEQVRLEIIDIWHFGLSELLRANQFDEELAERLAKALARDDTVGFRAGVENLALKSLATRRFDLEAFVAVMRALPMTFDELYRGYVAKNILNAFRQEHGYQDGSYRKRWHDGREDNEHLVEIVAYLDADADSFIADLGAALAARYALMTPAAGV